MPEITISELVRRSHDLAKEKGWYESAPNVPEKLALIHSEISEALEEFRRDGVRIPCTDCNGSRVYDSAGEPCATCEGGGAGTVEWWLGKGAKPEGFVIELADAVIRIADLCGALGLDLADAIETKHVYNAKRAYRHGGKRV